MIGLLCFLLSVLASPFKSAARLEAENAVLRPPLAMLHTYIGELFRKQAGESDHQEKAIVDYRRAIEMNKDYSSGQGRVDGSKAKIGPVPTGN